MGLIDVLKTIAVVVPMMAMVVVVILKQYFGIIANEFYFLSIAYGMCFLSAVSVKKVEDVVFKSALTMSSVFWGCTFMIYITTWVFANKPHSFILWCFAAAIIITIALIKWFRRWVWR